MAGTEGTDAGSLVAWLLVGNIVRPCGPIGREEGAELGQTAGKSKGTAVSLFVGWLVVGASESLKVGGKLG